MNKELAVGDRVVFTPDQGDDDSIGTIDSLCLPYANVLWDDSHETEMFPLKDLMPAPAGRGELEAEFKALAAAHCQEIDDLLIVAAEAMTKAENLSEEYGLPFSSSLSPLGQIYTPLSYQSKFGKLSKSFVADIVDVYPGGEYDNAGWEHSAVC